LSDSRIYTQEFYKDRRAKTIASARRILGILRERIPFRTVADIGCGSGTWLAVALELGAERVFGLEGDWVKQDMLDDPRINFSPSNLEDRVSLSEPMDLAISLEVAEHLTPDRAETFVDDICSISQRILFSAAIPNQGGVNHLNERWQSYWAGLFNDRDYQAADLIRPLIWSDKEIPVWYRQNTILYLSRKAIQEGVVPAYDQSLPMIDVVHPDLWTHRSKEPGLRERLHLVSGIPRAALNKVLKNR
jgi:cyclopropane fatty-acyl-phospholipid synthase-like methyltransferase